MKKHTVTMEPSPDGADLFIVIDGVKIAKRGRTGTPQAKTWIPLEPGFEVKEVLEGGERALEIRHNGVVIH